ncbi:hypothetical protein Pcinc_044215 [Petrolisthes cinctipes]|uniref:Uncharacterized protein n=1 Tax=Petrolisthes cinctipes TaxID=88211 RepID=A0AAE1BEM7_PETCI|nr:hypothetical protein Pcinc_044215 [Petrolisthes cinctipes]
MGAKLIVSGKGCLGWQDGGWVEAESGGLWFGVVVGCKERSEKICKFVKQGDGSKKRGSELRKSKCRGRLVWKDSMKSNPGMEEGWELGRERAYGFVESRERMERGRRSEWKDRNVMVRGLGTVLHGTRYLGEVQEERRGEERKRVWWWKIGKKKWDREALWEMYEIDSEGVKEETLLAVNWGKRRNTNTKKRREQSSSTTKTV